VRKHSHFQTPLENPSIQTHFFILVLLCCIKRLCIFGPKGAIQIRYYYYYYYYYYYISCKLRHTDDTVADLSVVGLKNSDVSVERMNDKINVLVLSYTKTKLEVCALLYNIQCS